MSWTTIYITGKTDFREEVKKKLEHSDQRYMPGFIENLLGETTHDLYWLDGRTDLRAFKEAIGGKIIWKYRLQFCLELEEKKEDEVQEKSVPLSDKENGMITAMRSKVALEF